MIQSISFIGSGNVATQMALAFHKKGIIISQIISSQLQNAETLAHQVKAQATNKISELTPNVDAVVIAVNDDKISTISDQITTNAIVVHTSGSTSMESISNCSPQVGVMWPIKSIRKNVTLDFIDVPFCIEGKDSTTAKTIQQLAQLISTNVRIMDEKQREAAHLAAVVANNFSNYFYSIAQDLLEEKNIDFSILSPLIIDAAKQIKDSSPKNLQTGPAVRKDQKIIDRHLKLLENHPEFRKLYKFVSQSIIKTYHG